MVDTGASLSLVAESFVKRLSAQEYVETQNADTLVCSAVGSKNVTITETIILYIPLKSPNGRVLMRHKFYVVENLRFQMYAGYDWLSKSEILCLKPNSLLLAKPLFARQQKQDLNNLTKEAINIPIFHADVHTKHNIADNTLHCINQNGLYLSQQLLIHKKETIYIYRQRQLYL